MEIGTVCDVFKVSLKRGQEANIILRFGMKVAQFRPMNLKVLDDDGIGLLQDT